MHGAFDVWGRGESPEKVWKRYFETLAEAARSGMYDIMAHPDLVKVWGDGHACPRATCAATTSRRSRRSPRPASPSRSRPPGCASRSARSTRRRAFLEMVVEAGCPIALSSDAHVPEHLGYGYDQALELLEEVGVTELACSRAGERRMEPIGPSDPHRHRHRHPPLRARPAADPRRRRHPARGGPRRPLRRRRPDPRDHRRAARRRRPGRHRPALPRHRRALQGRRLAGAAARGRRVASRRTASASSTSTRR